MTSRKDVDVYNLIVGFIDGEVWANRMLEYTEDAMRQYVVTPYGAVDVSRLASLPALVMPELQNRQSPQVARVGDIADLAFAGGNYRFQFRPNESVPAISTDRIERASRELHISSDFEFNHHYWAVKNVDLYRVLHDSILESALAPKLFRLPLEVPAEQDLVAVMMPFDAGFNDVYATLEQAVAESGMQCYRADRVWFNNQIMDDVINLIWRARVVIADLTSKNPNVFYETGIAHTLGRDVIQIAQSMNDVPFDIHTIRSVSYHPNREGLADLKAKVVERLKYLTTAS